MLSTLARRTRDEEAGFSLVELLVVIVILGILAGVVVFSVGGINDNGQDSACDADLAALETAEEAYFAQNDEYVDEAGLVSADLIRRESTLHNITLASGDYTVVPVAGGDCA